MAELDQAHESYELGMHTEQLSGRTQQVFFQQKSRTIWFTRGRQRWILIKPARSMRSRSISRK